MHGARAILEAELDTLVIHMEDPSTDFLKAIYEGKGYPVIRGEIGGKELTKAIQAHSRVFMLGHGGPGGLFTRGIAMDDTWGPLLAEKKDSLYIWCNADAYAHRNKLSGLVSGMFISEVMEARIFGIKATQEEVDQSNAAFSRVVREVIDTGAARTQVKERYTHATSLVTKFNNERLYIFENGVPSPALHPSSAAIERPPQNFSSHWQPEEPDEALYASVAGEINKLIDGLSSPDETAKALAKSMNLPRVAEDELYFELSKIPRMDQLEARHMLDDIVAWALEFAEYGY